MHPVNISAITNQPRSTRRTRHAVCGELGLPNFCEMETDFRQGLMTKQAYSLPISANVNKILWKLTSRDQREIASRSHRVRGCPRQ